MKKRARMVAQVVIGLLYISVIILWYFWLAHIPAVQAWVHDWGGKPDGVTALATLGAAVGTIGAVLVALYVTRYERIKAREDREDAQKRFTEEQTQAQKALDDERQRFDDAQAAAQERFKVEREQFEKAQEESRRQFLEAQKQAQEAQEEARRQFLEAQYAASHPLIVPIVPEAGFEQLSKLQAQFPWNAPFVDIKIRNVGTGIATNVWGVVMPSEPMPNSAFQFSHRYACPLSVNEEEVAYFTKGGTLFTCDDKIGQYTLCVPKERAPEEGFANTNDRRDRCVVRLTLTYADIFGRKHASIFDYTLTNMWVCVAFIPDIEHDLGEMDEVMEIMMLSSAHEIRHYNKGTEGTV